MRTTIFLLWGMAKLLRFSVVYYEILTKSCEEFSYGHVPVKHKQMQLASIINLLGRGLMITVSYNAYCAITKEGDNDIWTVRPRGVVPLLPLCSQIDVGATVNALLGDTFSRENNTHGSRFHDRDPQFASRILGAMTQSCYIGTRDIWSRVIRGLYCIKILNRRINHKYQRSLPHGGNYAT